MPKKHDDQKLKNKFQEQAAKEQLLRETFEEGLKLQYNHGLSTGVYATLKVIADMADKDGDAEKKLECIADYCHTHIDKIDAIKELEQQSAGGGGSSYE